MRPEIRNLLIGGWLLTQLFYVGFYVQSGEVFGKSDIGNYVRLCSESLVGTNGLYGLRHGLMQAVSCAIGEIGFLLFIPALFWLGLVWPLILIRGEHATLCVLFGTAFAGLYFVVGLLSQFLSISFMLWGIWAYQRGHRWVALGLGLLSFNYLPIAYFYVTWFAGPLWGAVTFILLCFFSPDKTVYTEGMGFPLYGFLFYVSPVLLIKVLRRSDDSARFKLFLMGLVRSGRGLIFWLPFIEEEQDEVEWFLTWVWWLAANGVILIGYMLEKGFKLP